MAHFLRQNNNEIYIKEIQPIVDEIASNFDFQEVLFNYAKTSNDIEIGLLNGKYQNILAKEIIEDTLSSIYGDLSADYRLSEEIINNLKLSIDEILNSSQGLDNNSSSFNLQNNQNITPVK